MTNLSTLKEILESYDARYVEGNLADSGRGHERKLGTKIDAIIDIHDKSDDNFTFSISLNKPEILAHIRLTFGTFLNDCSSQWPNWYWIDYE